MKIVAVNKPGDCLKGKLSSTLSVDDITRVLGFLPNVADDSFKVNNSWGFTADDELCGIWDYKGSCWSTYGSDHVFEKLFPGQYTSLEYYIMPR